MKINKFIPLYFFQVYLFCTALLYVLGPWPWSNNQTINVFLYLLLSQLAIAIGYVYGAKLQKNIRLDSEMGQLDVLNGVRFIKQAILINALLFIPLSLSRTGSLIPNVFFGISHPGQAYLENIHRLHGPNPFVFAEYLRSFLSPWTIGLLPVLIIYWSSLSLFYKRLASLCVILNMTFYLATGVNKGLADFVITFPWFFFLYKKINHPNFRIEVKHLLIVLLMLTVFLTCFGFAIEGRGSVSSAFTYDDTILLPNQNPKLYLLLPDFIRLVYQSMALYLTQGYYALSLAFTIPQSWTYGLGSSMVVARNADKFFNTNYFESSSIPGLLQYFFGWSREGSWHSIYSWLASDFGFVGTLVVMGAFGFLLATSWCRVINNKKPFDIVLLYLLFIVFYYIPANNQVFQSLEGFLCFNICFLVLLGQTLLSRFRKK